MTHVWQYRGEYKMGHFDGGRLVVVKMSREEFYRHIYGK